jgi:hypothetical protein
VLGGDHQQALGQRGERTGAPGDGGDRGLDVYAGYESYSGARERVFHPRGGEPDDLPGDGELDELVDRFTCDDIRKTHQELTARGVAFPDPPSQTSWGWWATFTDNEGNLYGLGQGSAE